MRAAITIQDESTRTSTPPIRPIRQPRPPIVRRGYRSALGAYPGLMALSASQDPGTLPGDDRPGGLPSERIRVVRVRDGLVDEGPDAVAAEEPLEIRLNGEQVAVTMRTPGNDAELAVGFLHGEGIVRPGDVASVFECRSDEGDGGVADVRLRPGIEPSGGWQRNFYATSSCGVCGKASIEAVRLAAPPVEDGPVIASGILST